MGVNEDMIKESFFDSECNERSELANDELGRGRRRQKIKKVLGYGAGISAAGIAALFVAAYAYANSYAYEMSKCTQKQLELLKFRQEWVKRGLQDPCSIIKKGPSRESWKCSIPKSDLPSLDIEVKATAKKPKNEISPTEKNSVTNHGSSKKRRKNRVRILGA